jgi:GNAT superfamily N-acetyltransferase
VQTPEPPHPLAELITAAAAGRFVAADGGWHRVPPWRDGLEAVVGFTGHAVFALGSDVTDARLVALGADGFGGAHDPRLIAAVAGPGAWIDSLDVLMAGRGTGDACHAPARLVERPDLVRHPRVRFAAQLRDDCRVLGHPDWEREAVAIVGRGIAGLTELSFELEPGRRGTGAGRALIGAALGTVPAGEMVLSAVAPGNAASLRALLSAGFVPLGSSQVFRRV